MQLAWFHSLQVGDVLVPHYSFIIKSVYLELRWCTSVVTSKLFFIIR
jgi:hypothetical protein